MMAAFLDSVGVAHEDGLITEENVTKPEVEKLKAAAAELEVLARAHHAHLRDGNRPGAVRAAFWLGVHLTIRGEVGRAGGWLGRAQRLLPGLWRLRHYQRSWLRGDLLAGITVAAYLIPQVMAYAEVAGLPPIAGLWAVVGPLILYAVLGSSPQLSVGPESSTALMTAVSVAGLVTAGQTQTAAVAAALAPARQDPAARVVVGSRALVPEHQLVVLLVVAELREVLSVDP